MTRLFEKHDSLRNFIIIIFIIFVFQFMIVLPSLISPNKALLFGDSQIYVKSALNLINYGIYSDNDFLHPAHFKPPGYPIFLAGIFAIIGFNIRFVILVQIFLIIIFSIFVYYLTLLVMSDKRAALTSMLLAGISPNVAFHAGFILSEPLFVNLMLITLYFFLLYLYRIHTKFAIISGICLAFTILVRAVAILVPIPLFIYLFLTKRLTKKILFDMLILTVIVVIMLLPWIIRNYRIFNRLFIGTTGDVTAFIWAERTYAFAKGVSEKEAADTLESEVLREIQDGEQWNEARVMGLRLKVALKYIARYPLHYLILHIFSFMRVAFQPLNFSEILAYYSKNPVSTWQKIRPIQPFPKSADRFRNWLRTIYYGRLRLIPLTGYLLFFGQLCYLLILYYGIIRCILIKPRPLEGWLISLLITIYLIFMSGAHPEVRFRVSAEPLMAMVAGIGIAAAHPTCRYLQFWRRRDKI